MVAKKKKFEFKKYYDGTSSTGKSKYFVLEPIKGELYKVIIIKLIQRSIFLTATFAKEFKLYFF